MSEFENGKKIKVKNGDELTILETLGSGGQGTVYKISYLGKEYALKWYHTTTFNDEKHAREFYLNIENNINKGAPTEDFLWPLGITVVTDGSFGYFMKLRPKNFHELTEFFVGTKKEKQVHFKSFHAQTTAAINIINSFDKLHKRGYSYQDINNGNFFINNETGDVLICDNDNVAPEGTNLGIQGKQRWMAPEVVTGKKEPNKHSDRFSLSVVLFRLLFINHPLEGKYSTPPCMTKSMERKYYGEKPIFIYDPNDDSNRPVPGTDKNLKLFWNAYPTKIKKMFEHAFSQDVMQLKENRILESQWLNAFMELRSQIIKCPFCGQEVFYDTHSKEYNELPKCFSCGKNLPQINVLQTVRFNIPIFPSQTIYSYYIDTALEDIDVEIASIVKNASNPHLLGIQNKSKNNINIKLHDGTVRSLIPGATAPANEGYVIDFLTYNKFDSKIINY